MGLSRNEFCLKYTCIPTNAFENDLNFGTRKKFKQRSVLQNVIKEIAVIVVLAMVCLHASSNILGVDSIKHIANIDPI